MSAVAAEPAARHQEVGERIASARRAAGLTQAELAAALEVPLWQVDRMERGTVDATPFLEPVGAITGWPPNAFLPTRVPEHAAAHIAAIEEEPATANSRDRRRWIVAGAITTLVLIRFFSEKVGILPKQVTFIDVPLFFVLLAAMFAAPRRDGSQTNTGFATLAFAFFVWALLAVLANLGRIAPAPVGLFMYGFLAPVLVYYAVYALWPPGNARFMARLLVALGVTQVVVGALYDFPRFLSSGNPDVMSGTFGDNGYQMAIVLMVIISIVAGASVYDKGTFYSRAAPLLIGGMVMQIFLVQYRQLLPIIAATLLLVGFYLAAGRLRGMIAIGATGVMFMVAFSFAADNFARLKYDGAVSSLTTAPAQFVEGRLGPFQDVADVYAEDTVRVLTGTGPGTFSSRAWRTFADLKRTRTAVATGLAERLNGGQYATDVGERYTFARYRNAVSIEGSRAATQPFTSWAALAAEVGIPGVFLLMSLYLLAFLQAARLALALMRERISRDPIMPLMIGCVAAFAILIQVALLENWLEVTRVTFISWALLAVATKELDARRARSAAVISR